MCVRDVTEDESSGGEKKRNFSERGVNTTNIRGLTDHGHEKEQNGGNNKLTTRTTTQNEQNNIQGRY